MVIPVVFLNSAFAVFGFGYPQAIIILQMDVVDVASRFCVALILMEMIVSRIDRW